MTGHVLAETTQIITVRHGSASVVTLAKIPITLAIGIYTACM